MSHVRIRLVTRAIADNSGINIVPESTRWLVVSPVAATPNAEMTSSGMGPDTVLLRLWIIRRTSVADRVRELRFIIDNIKQLIEPAGEPQTHRATHPRSD